MNPCQTCSFVRMLFDHLAGKIIDWCKRHGREDHLYNEDGSVYMYRWEVIRTRWLGVRLHHTSRPDMDRHLHDHPWWNISLMLRGGYLEELPLRQRRLEWYMHPLEGVVKERARRVWRTAGHIVFRSALTRHRLVGLMPCVPTVSLFIVGRNWNDWGYYTPSGKVPARDYSKGPK